MSRDTRPRISGGIATSRRVLNLPHCSAWKSTSDLLGRSSFAATLSRVDVTNAVHHVEHETRAISVNSGSIRHDERADSRISYRKNLSRITRSLPPSPLRDLHTARDSIAIERRNFRALYTANLLSRGIAGIPARANFAYRRCAFRAHPTRQISIRISLTATISARGLKNGNSANHHRETNFSTRSRDYARTFTRYRIGTSEISGRPENLMPQNLGAQDCRQSWTITRDETRGRRGRNDKRICAVFGTCSRGVYS